MKNGQKKSNSIRDRLTSFVAFIRRYRETQSEDLKRHVILVGIGAICALIIQNVLGLDRIVGGFLLITLILFIFFKDIKRYKPLFINNDKMMLLLGILVVGTLLSGKGFEYLLNGLQRGLELPPGTSWIYGIPLPAGAMLVTLIFDFHMAIIFSFVISLISGLWLFSPFYIVYTFIGSLTAAFCIHRCKRRSSIIRAGLLVGIVNTGTAAGILLFTGGLLIDSALPTFLFAALSGITVAALVSIVLPVIEYFFGITTDISLIELLDVDQPVLRSMMTHAPGTYHHSVIVGNLTEAAAEAVGANPLLARVCSYYHDIGKIRMPEYFVENQAGIPNKHEKLSPTMSSMILISHVREGIEMAKTHKLPQAVSDIIQQHHGTSLISFFYNKAKEQSPDAPPDEDSYRYPGPKPQTRVAALVMMADAVEAASRTIGDPTPARIAALVEKIINNIYLAGQIDECELTLKDISEIKKRFTFVLTSIFHRRVEYPNLPVKGTPGREQLPAIPGKDNGNNSVEPAKANIVPGPDHQTDTQRSPQHAP